MKSVFIFILLLGSFAHAEEDPAKAAAEAAAKLGLHHESELGYIVVGGNAKSQSFSGKQSTWYQFDHDLLKWSAHYLNTRAQNQITKQLEGTAENWSTALRYEHIIIPNELNGFVQGGIRGDRFIGVDFAQYYDIGAKYYWISNDSVKLFSEFGYQYLKEEFIPVLGKNPVSEAHFLRLYSQVDYIYSPSIKFGVWVEYLPNIKDEENYRVNYSPYMLAILSDTFSLKFGYEGMYRNIPVSPNVIRTDYRHITALIAKF